MQGDLQLGQVVTIDGSIAAPRMPYPQIDSEMNKIHRSNVWPTVDAMLASIRQNAPEPKGLPEGAPNPNTVYLKNGQYVRYIVDTSETAEPFVENGVVKRPISFKTRAVSLSLEGARKATAAGTDCDYWNGFTWFRKGYTPERDFPVMMHQASLGVAGERLIFAQPVSPSDEAQIRHEVSHMDRSRPTLPVGSIDATVSAAQSVPFPEADAPAPASTAPTDDFTPPEASRKPARSGT